MKRKALWVLILSALVLAGASVAVYAGFVDEDTNQHVEVVFNPPGGAPCYCPAQWRPVVCWGQDHTKHYFSNACVAGCSGFTRCAEVRLKQVP